MCFYNEQAAVANFRADYAKGADFCKALERDMKSFYLLTFLLTANHIDAEQCFGAIIEEVFDEDCVFKLWVGSWIKRCLIKKAIQVVFSRSTGNNERRNLWWDELGETRLRNVVNAVIGLRAAERFVFVMSVLEHYSAKECSLLLDSTINDVVQLRARASRRLAAYDPFSIGNLTRPGRRESA